MAASEIAWNHVPRALKGQRDFLFAINLSQMVSAKSRQYCHFIHKELTGFFMCE